MQKRNIGVNIGWLKIKPSDTSVSATIEYSKIANAFMKTSPPLYKLHKGKAPVVQTVQTSFIIFVQNIENKKIIKNFITTY